jgi:transposase
MDERQQRGLELAATRRIEQQGETWIVPSQTGDGRYTVRPDAVTCTCPDYERRSLPCKHLFAVEYVRQREIAPDGTVTETEAVRVTYSQNWPVYNAAQTHEHDHFLPLLRELCDGIEQPLQTNGRPRLLLSDVVFALGVKTYSTLSARRATSFVRDAAARGLMDAAPSYNSALRYLESPALTDVLKSLIEESAKPLAAIESDFAIDSTGIGTTTYRRWYDHKWGKERSTQTWVKLHAMTGVTTNVVTAVEATATESPDAPQLPKLLARTAENFEVREVSGDKAYSSRANLRAIDNIGAVPFIPFRAGTTGSPTSHHERGYDGLWMRMWHYYQFRRSDFLGHYHKRSNAETTFSMIKAKFGGSVRAKTPVAQVNEALMKVLCHNVVVLIQSVYELGIDPVFWQQADCPKTPVSASKAVRIPGF